MFTNEADALEALYFIKQNIITQGIQIQVRLDESDNRFHIPSQNSDNFVFVLFILKKKFI